ncbi:MAG: HlyC/CorC family transporter [Calditrichaeota bacterium]|nr:MAG: HlyC/CorC family transporter [Calditrichota bacterium]MBL1204283.1 HlyC/CorC family transporter [Calditrichota bacterium]NOG44113.1 HlyC/CorC family transporter [Calditrichota bacterium]
MDPSSLFTSFIFLFFILLSAFFLGIKTALFSLNSSTLTAFSESEKSPENQISRLMESQRRVLLTIVIGNSLSGSFALISALAITSPSYVSNGSYYFLNNILGVLIFIVFYLVVGEILSKYLASKNPKAFSKVAVYIFLLFYYLLFPFTFVLEKISNKFSSSLGMNKDKTELSEDELRYIVDVDGEGDALKKDEREMIHSIFEMSETVAREIMVPRPDMISVEDNTSITQLLKINKDKNHSRIPVYKESVDNIVGVLHIKDLLPLIKKRSYADFDIMKLINEPYFVPEQKKVNELLREFRAESIHMAIVVDEYGGTAGIVTLEDVIEEIVGEIQDEYDEEAPQLNAIDENTFLVNGSMLIDDLNEGHDFNLPEEEGIDTLAGFLLGQFGSVPKTKSKIRWENYDFIVERVYRRRIERVRIIKGSSLKKED